MAQAKGEWIQFLDSDDFLAPQKFELQMSHCITAPADVVAVYSPWRQCVVDGEEIVPIGALSTPQMHGRAPIICFVGNDRPLHSAGLARRTALEQIGGFDERLRFWECEEVTFRLAKIGRLECVPSPTPLYLWRQHPERPYLGGDEARYRTIDVAMTWIEFVLDGLGHKPLSDLELSAADRDDILRYSTYLARLVFRQDRSAFRRYIALARQLDPSLAPAYPVAASLLSRPFGYEAAESIANLARAPMTLARSIRRWSQPRDGEKPLGAVSR